MPIKHKQTEEPNLDFLSRAQLVKMIAEESTLIGAMKITIDILVKEIEKLRVENAMLILGQEPKKYRWGTDAS